MSSGSEFVRAPSDLQRSYAAVADEYVARIYDELRHKPLDRELLDRLVREAAPLGPLCDVGCGPGQVARYLRDRGAVVSGLDLSEAMLARARMQNPDLAFHHGDLRALPFPDESLGGIAAFYALVHLPRAEVTAALRELGRVLRRGGALLIAFHLGDEVIHLDEWWGKPVSVDFTFFRTNEMAGYVRHAGLLLAESIERDPYPEVEHPSRRAYLLAKKP